MGVYSVGFLPREVVSQPMPYFDLLSLYGQFALLEISWSVSNTSAITHLGVAPATSLPSQLNARPLPNEDPTKDPSRATYATAWAVAPTPPATYYRRCGLQPQIVIFEFPRGLIVPRNRSLCVFSTSGADVNINNAQPYFNLVIEE